MAGRNVSFYGARGDKFKSLMGKAKDVAKKSAQAGFKDVNLYMGAPKWNADRVFECMLESPAFQKYFRDGTLASVRVLTADGKMVIVTAKAAKNLSGKALSATTIGSGLGTVVRSAKGEPKS